MKIRSAVPENGCLIFFDGQKENRKQKTKKTSVKHIRYRLIGGCVNYSVSQKNPPRSLRFSDVFPKWLGIFSPNFTRLLHIPIYARLQIFTQLSATLTKLCHIKRDHPVHVICSNCPPSAQTHARWSHLTWHNFVTVGYNGIKICNLA